jgi:MFS family permease
MTIKNSRREILSLFFPLYLPAFLFSFSQSLLLPVLPLYAQSFDIPYELVGLVLAGDAIGMILGDLPAGMLMRRIGQKRAMTAGLTLAGLSTAGLFFASSIVWVVLLRAVTGVGVSLFSVSRHYFLTEMAPPATRGRIISLFGGLFRLGRMLGPVAGGGMAVAFGLRASFLLFGVICLLALLVVIFLLPNLEVSREGEVEMLVSPLNHFWRMLRDQRHVIATAGMGFLFMQLLRSGPTVIIPLYAANALHLDVQTIGLVLSISAALDMALFYPAGMIMDRFGRRYTIIPSALGLSLGLSLLPFTTNLTSLLLVGMLLGLGNGLGSGAMITTGSDLAPKRERSEFLGAWNLVGDIGATSGPLAVGALADGIPLAHTGWIIALAGLAAAFIFGRLVPETGKRPAKNTGD